MGHANLAADEVFGTVCDKAEGTPEASAASSGESVAGRCVGVVAVTVGAIPFIRKMGVDFAFLKSRDDAWRIDGEVFDASF